MRKNFIRIVENFKCENCGAEVEGTGYTNHCPKCLWSKHVDDKVPGDRASSCQGPMEPVGIEQKGAEWRIVHRCIKCKKTTKNKIALSDNWGQLAMRS